MVGVGISESEEKCLDSEDPQVDRSSVNWHLKVLTEYRWMPRKRAAAVVFVVAVRESILSEQEGARKEEDWEGT
jgi:hypothetical protein